MLQRSLSRVLFPAVHFTVADLESAYLQLAPYLLPHLRNRPLSIRRYPDDIHGTSFWEKEMPGFAPEWMEAIPVPRVAEPGDIQYVVVNNERALRWIASVGAIEMHPFLHTGEDLNRPTAVVFDLDPGEGADLLAACTVAIAIREFLRRYHLECFPKVSGAKGMQVYLPLNSETSYAQTEALARKLAETLARQMPQLIVADIAKLLRRGRVLIDCSQNSP